MSASRKSRQLSSSNKSSSKGAFSKSLRSHRLGFESLELRRMMAALVVPEFNSLPGAAKSLYLDFDGSAAFDWVGAPEPYNRAHGPGSADAPIPAFSLDGNLNDFTDGELKAIETFFNDVAEKFSPFNINVTTVRPPNLNDFEAITIIIGGSVRDWSKPDSGFLGIALGGFTDPDFGNEGFIFSADSIDPGSVELSDADRDLIGEAIAHEAGHQFGLDHQTIFGADGSVIEEYSSGNALGTPIMGSAGKLANAGKHGVWFNGTASYRDENKMIVAAGMQDDLDRLYSVLGARPDDFGPGSSWTVNDNQGHFASQGIIGNLLDTDSFRFTATGTSGYFSIDNQGTAAMLTPRLELRTWPDYAPVASFASITSDDFASISFIDLVVGQEYVVVASSNFEYGSLGQYTIFGSNTNNFATVDNRVLHVNGFDNVDDDIQLDIYYLDQPYYYVDNVVNGNVISLLVPVSDVDQIVVKTGTGNDSVRYRAPIGPTISFVDMGAGIDTLEVRGGIGADAFMINGYNVNVSGTQVNFTDSVELLIGQGLGGDDVFNVLTSSKTGLLLYGGDNNDTATFGSTVLGSNSTGGDLFFGGNGADTLGFIATTAAEHTYTVGSSPYYEGSVTASINGVGRSVGHSEVETVRLDGGVLADKFNIDYIRSGRTVVANGNDGADTFAIGRSLGGSLTTNGNNGNDSFIVGGGNVGSTYSSGAITGGAGNDSIVFDDSQYAGAANWAITDTNVQRNIPGFAKVFSYAGFEGVGIKTGAGGATANNITTFGAIPVSVTVTGGAGRDNFYLNNFANEAAGGAFGPEQLQSMFDGGGGFNQLIVDDSARGSLTYNMYPDRLQIRETLADDGDFRFAGIGAMSVTASNSFTAVNVYGTPASIAPGNQTTFMLRGGNDVANLYPHDAAGNLTITTNLGIVGEAGTDTVTIQDAASADAINYLFSNPNGAGTQNIFGLGAGMFGTATVENLVVNAGAGDDVFDVKQYASGTSLTLNAGAGNDVLNLGNGNLQANITSIAALTFNGQADDDAINLNNAASTAAYTYRRNTGTLSAATGSYVLNVNETNAERIAMNAGAGADVFRITAVPTNTSLDLSGGAAIDALLVGDLSLNVSSIAGPITFDTGADAGRVQVVDTNSTVGKTAHLELDSLGAAPGDNLFGPGGSLHFTTLVNQVAGFSFDAMSILLGGGADTIYAQPFATGTVGIEGRNPTTTPGDELHLALAGAQNYVLNGTPASGSVTSDNLQKLSYFGFESEPIIEAPPIDVPPADPIPADFDGNNVVNGDDFLAWQRGLGAPAAGKADGDADGDGDVDGDDLAVWMAGFGVVEVAMAARAEADEQAPPEPLNLNVELAAASIAAPESESAAQPNAPLSAKMVDLTFALPFDVSRLEQSTSIRRAVFVQSLSTEAANGVNKVKLAADNGHSAAEFATRTRRPYRPAAESTTTSVSNNGLAALALDEAFACLL